MTTNSLPTFLELWQQTLHWQPHTQQLTQFQELYTQILITNQKLNLTRITTAADFWEKHLWDSLIGIQPAIIDWEKPGKIIDIGTGGGFPGLPVAIALPQAQLTLLDATRKKIIFLRELSQYLGLTNVETIIARAEETGQDPEYRQNYDVTLVRAVAPASVCAEYSLPLLKIGGIAVLYRGHWTASEAEQLEKAVSLLGGKVEQTLALTTPLSQSIRHCLYLRKVAPTPSLYPRRVGIPTKEPLGVKL